MSREPDAPNSPSSPTEPERLNTSVEELAASISDLHAKLDALVTGADTRKKRFVKTKTATSFVDLSEGSIRRLIASGKLVGYRPVAGTVLVDRLELEALVRNSTSRPRKGRGQNRQT